jgi:hypothetical protein
LGTKIGFYFIFCPWCVLVFLHPCFGGGAIDGTFFSLSTDTVTPKDRQKQDGISRCFHRHRYFHWQLSLQPPQDEQQPAQDQNAVDLSTVCERHDRNTTLSHDSRTNVGMRVIIIIYHQRNVSLSVVFVDATPDQSRAEMADDAVD